ncbi:MAG: hypothetical protein H6R18_2269 [Proteobacteria bacterium]|nr:hypothetical protein [Pseudomonadota bacterium]
MAELELLEDWQDCQILEFAALFVEDHFGKLRYPHSRNTHQRLLEDLENQRIQSLIWGALMYEGSNPHASLDTTLSKIRQAALASEKKGLVLPDGQRRRAALKAMGVPV